MTNSNQELHADIAREGLEAFIISFNHMLEESESNHETLERQEEIIKTLQSKNLELALYKNEAEGYKRQVKAQQSEIDDIKEKLLLAEQNQKSHIANSQRCQSLERELEMTRKKAQELSRQLAELKGGANPEKLKAQIKRVKDKSLAKNKRITRLETESKQYKYEIKKLKTNYQDALTKIETLSTEKSNLDFTGIYHNGDHHLVLWPQVNTIQKPDGSQYTCRSLLWMHQSGTGKLITFDKDNMAANLCKPPKGGVKIPEKVRQFADDWLFNVNVTQNGVVTPEDLKQTNLNALATTQ